MSKTRTQKAVSRTPTPMRRNEGRVSTRSTNRIGKAIPSPWYNGSAVRRNLEKLCAQACQAGSVFDTFGDKEKPLLQLRHDPRKTKSVKEFELTLAKAKLEWIAVPNAALLGVKFRLRVAANKFVVLSQHPKYKLTQIQQKEDETKIHQKEEMTMARQDKLIETLYDLVEQFTALSDKLDAKADLILTPNHGGLAACERPQRGHALGLGLVAALILRSGCFPVVGKPEWTVGRSRARRNTLANLRCLMKRPHANHC